MMQLLPNHRAKERIVTAKIAGPCVVAFLFAATFWCRCAKSPVSAEPVYGALDTTFSFVMGTVSYAIPHGKMPAKGEPFADPVFHTNIVRVSSNADPYDGPGIENEYARSDPENADGSSLILRGNSGVWYLYDARTFKRMQQLTVFNDGLQEPEPRWDFSNPGVFYFLSNTELRRYEVSAEASAAAHDFKAEFADAAIITTGTEGDASVDRRYWCFMVQDSAGKLLGVLCYDLVADSVVGTKSSGFPDGINWVSSDMSGAHCVIGYEDSDTDQDDITPPVQAFSRDFATSTTLPTGSTGHMDLALRDDGADVMVYQNNATDWIAVADLATGAETPLLEIPFGVNPDIGLHFSGNCNGAPGWVLVSTYGSENTPPGAVHSWMDTQLFMVELKANPRVWRIAFTQAYSSKEYSGEKNYFAEAFAAVNAQGSRIYFGSNWRNYTTEYSDAYVVNLPAHWRTSMP
jgi:hypothetical protein